MCRALKHTCTNGVATYVLVHGSKHSSWHWRLVVPALEALGHDARAVDLPCNDDNAGLDEYADAVVEAGASGAVSCSWHTRWPGSRSLWPANAWPPC